MIIARIPFPLPPESKDGISNMEVELPTGAKIVSVAFVPPTPGRLRLVGFDPHAMLLLFAMLDPEETTKEKRRFVRWPDQSTFREGVGDYIGTAMKFVGETSLEVVHVFELPVVSNIIVPGNLAGKPS